MSESLPTRLRWTASMAARAPLQARFPFRSRAAIGRARDRRAREAVAYAHREVPYYRETMRRLGLSLADVRGAADLARLPLIERDQVQRDPEYFTAAALALDRCVRHVTSGTTGTPLAVFHHPAELTAFGAYRQRGEAVVRKLAGRRLRLRQLSVAPPGNAADRNRTAFGASSLLPSSLARDETRVSPRLPMRRVAELIAELRPDAFFSLGSYLEAFFAWADRERVELPGLRVVRFGSEALAEPARRLISEQFGLEVIGSYGSVETFNIGFECERHRGYHLNEDLNPVRIVDSAGGEVAEGEGGEVVVSNLVSRGTMLLNYRLGDLATRLPESCGCGRRLPLLSYLEGRIGDWIRTGSGEAVHPLVAQQVMNAQAGALLRFRIVQRAPGELSIAAIARDGCDRDATARRILDQLAERLGTDTRVELRWVAHLSGGHAAGVVSTSAEA